MSMFYCPICQRQVDSDFTETQEVDGYLDTEPTILVCQKHVDEIHNEYTDIGSVLNWYAIGAALFIVLFWALLFWIVL